jgi:hypothetical protein
MSKDVKLIVACNHIVNGKTYESDRCPKCYGKGYYYDIYFDGFGQPSIAEGNIKLQQEMLKIIIDHKYHNQFHKLWGSDVNSMIGSKNININKSKLELIIRDTLQHLRNVQISEQIKYNNITDEEILDKILYINIMPLGPTGYNIEVIISNDLGQTFVQTIKI